MCGFVLFNTFKKWPVLGKILFLCVSDVEKEKIHKCESNFCSDNKITTDLIGLFFVCNASMEPMI